MNGVLLLASVFVPFAAALLAAPLARRLGSAAGRLLALAFVPALALVVYVPEARAGAPVEAVLPWVPGIGLELAFRADGFSLAFALLVGFIGALILLYAASYLGKGERYGRFYGYLLLFGGAMLGLVLTDNLVALFAFWELTSISSFLLIGFWDSRRASQDGAVKALLVTSLGGLALLVATVLLALAGGTWSLSSLDAQTVRASPYFGPIAVLLMLAAFTKSAQLPFHLWLPTAMEAPTPVSAFLHSATMVKAGVMLIAKLGFLFAGTGYAEAIQYFGLATLFWGSYLALRQNDLKALLAYSTISQLGLLISLYGAGHAFAATAHLVNHAAFKATLFLVVGIIDHETGSRDISALGGLRRKLPITFALAVPAALSMAGLPPFGGFISKELFYEETLHDGILPIVIAVAGSILTFAYSIRFLSVFFGAYRCQKPEVHEAPPALWLPVAPLAAAVLLFGLVPPSDTVASFFTRLAAPSFGYRPESLYLWHGLNVVLALSVLTWFFGAAVAVVRDRFVSLQQRLTPAWNANTVYYAILDLGTRAAGAATYRTQGATFATHVRIIFTTVALAGLYLGLRSTSLEAGPVPLGFWVVALLVAGGTVGVIVSNSRLDALISMGLAGFGTTLAFVLMRAPDLALTQLLIEVVTVILFLSTFRYLPKLTRYARPLPVAGLDAVIASLVGFTVFASLLAVQQPIAPRIRDFFLEHSKTLGGGYNVVNVILVDFRGYDTMGEITVLGIVAVSVYALLRLRSKPRPEGEEEQPS